MSYSYKCYSDTKDFMKKFVNAEEGAIIYGISKSRIIVIAREAGAVYIPTISMVLWSTQSEVDM